MAKPVLLLVESNEEVLKQIQRDLERRYGRRYRVRAATSGREGLEELRGLKEDDDLVALVLAGWALDRDPFWLESSQPGVFVAGDVRHGSVKRVAAGVGEGATAVQFIHQYLGSGER
jgi:thioredoxin reductase